MMEDLRNLRGLGVIQLVSSLKDERGEEGLGVGVGIWGCGADLRPASVQREAALPSGRHHAVCRMPEGPWRRKEVQTRTQAALALTHSPGLRWRGEPALLSHSIETLCPVVRDDGGIHSSRKGCTK